MQTSRSFTTCFVCLTYQLLQMWWISLWLFLPVILSGFEQWILNQFCYLHSGLLYILVCFQKSLSVTFMIFSWNFIPSETRNFSYIFCSSNFVRYLLDLGGNFFPFFKISNFILNNSKIEIFPYNFSKFRCQTLVCNSLKQVSKFNF